MASLAPLTIVPSTGSSQIGDKEVEELLSEKLLEGYAILDASCPECVTPLVKRKSSALSPKRYVQTLSPRKATSPYGSMTCVPVQLQPTSPNAGSFDAAQSFTPIANVPMCVSCQAHVVTCEADLSILQSNNAMKDKGRIILAMEEEEGREAPDVASPARIAEKSFFASEQTEQRESPEDYVEETTSDKENDVMEETRDDVVEDVPEFEPEELSVQDEEEMVEDSLSVDKEKVVIEDSPSVDEEVVKDLPSVDEEVVMEESLSVDDGEVETPVPATKEDPPSVQDYVQEDDTPAEEENSIAVEVSDETKETFDKYDASEVLAKQTSPSMASFLCASTASYQYVVPSPVPSPKASYMEEEGIEHGLDEHTKCMERTGSEAAFSALLPPKPLVSDLLQEDEEEELDQAREAMSPSVKHSPRTKQDDVSDEIEEDETSDEEKVMQEYSVRRDIATKVLGAKMLQGYSLMETQCLKCGMPLMENNGQVDCVVCPVLVKKAKKKAKEQEEAKLLAEKKARIEADIAAKKKAEEEAFEAKVRAEQQEALAIAEQEALEAEEARIQAEKEAEEARIRVEEEATRQAEAEREAALRAEKEEESRMREAAVQAELSTSRSASPGIITLSDGGSLLSFGIGPTFSRATDYKNSFEEAVRMEEESRLAEEALLLTDDDTWSHTDLHADSSLAEGVLRAASMEKQAAMDALHAAEEEERIARERLIAASDQALEAAEEEERLALEALRLAQEEQMLAQEDGDESPDEDSLEDESIRIAEEEEMAALQMLRAAEEEEMAAKEALRAAEEEENLANIARRAEERKRAALEALRAAEEEERVALEALHEEERKREEEMQRKTQEARQTAEEEERNRRARIEEEERIRRAEIEQAEKARLEAQQEAQREVEAREAHMLEELERDAREKTREAEKAMLKAQAALDQVSSVRKKMYAKTIAQADLEAIAEAEAIVKSEAEDFKEISPSKSSIDWKHWETLRIEGRTLLARRTLQGWTVLTRECKGVECNNMFLLSHNNKIECTVCGGTGTGFDGAYQVEAIDDSVSTAGNATEDVDNDAFISDNREVEAVDEEPSTRSIANDDEDIQPSEDNVNGVSTENAVLEKGATDVTTKEEHSVNEVVTVASIRSASENCSVTISNSEHHASRADSDMPLRVETPSIDHREVIGSPRSTTSPRSVRSTTSPRSVYKSTPRTPDIGPSFDECPVSPTGSATRSVAELKEDFEAKRLYVSKEIGKMMMKGWTLLDMSCPECLMPLLRDPRIGQETCVLCGPTAKLSSAITVHEQKHDPPVDPPSADEEDAVTQASILSRAKSEKPEPSQELSLKNETEVIETETKDANVPKQTFSLQLPASFDMTDEDALRTLISLVKANQTAVKAEVNKGELPPRPSPVISTSQAADDVSHVTMDTPTNGQIQSPRTPATSQSIDVPEVLQEESKSFSQMSQRSDGRHDILEDEAGVEIMRKVSSLEPFDEARAFLGEQCSIDGSPNTAESFGDYPVEAPKRELTTDEDSVASRCSKLLEKLESCSVTSRLASEASYRASRDCDNGSIASPRSAVSRHSEVDAIKQQSSYTSGKDAGSVSSRRSKLSVSTRFSQIEGPEIEQQLTEDSGSVHSRHSKTSVSSRLSNAPAIEEQTSYTSLTSEQELEYHRQFNAGSSRVSPLASPQMVLPPRPTNFRPLTPTSPPARVPKRTSPRSTGNSPSVGKGPRGPPRPESFGKKSPAASPSVRSFHPLTPTHKRAPPPFPGSSPREVSHHRVSSRDDNSVRSELSRSGSVASQALDSIMKQIDECKFNLISSDDPEYQAHQAALLEKLGSAAVARGPPRPESFGKKSPAASPSVRSFHPLTPTHKRAPPPFPGSSPREVSHHRVSSRDDNSVRSELSRSGSVASQALDSIMKQIDECKFNLISSDDPEYQAHQAALLEKLGSAAVAMRRLEESV